MQYSNKNIQYGQPRAYADSLYVYSILAPAEATDAEVWAYCQTVYACKNRADNQRHDGSCGFPFGLQSYGSLKKESATTYRYSVTQPYCD
jgi:hypothetical protein